MNERTDENSGASQDEPGATAASGPLPAESWENGALADADGGDDALPSNEDGDELAQAAADAGGPPAKLGAPPLRGRSRAGLFVWLAIAAAAVVLGVMYGPQLVRRVAELRIQRACAEYVAPRTLVVYEEQPDKAATLLGVAGEHVAVSLPAGGGPPVAGHVPSAWRTMRRWAFPAAHEPTGALLFLHERQTAVGVRGIVAVEADRAARRLRVSFIHPGTYGSAPTPVTDLTVKEPPKEGMIVWSEGRDPFESKLPEDPAARVDLRFFAGQADADDWTHIVIPYELNADGGELELWLVDESTVHYIDRRIVRERTP